MQAQLEEFTSAEEILGLHRCASAWFAEHAYCEEAIEHALRGQALEAAVVVVDQARHQLMNTDQWHRLERWLRMFSQTEVRRSAPLMVLRCWLDMSHWYRIENLARDLEFAAALIEGGGRTAQTEYLGQEVAVMRCALAYWTLEPDSTLALSKSVLNTPPGEREYVQSIALLYTGAAIQLKGDVPQAERLLWQGIDQPGLRSPGSQALIMQSLCFIYWIDADLRKLGQAGSRLLQLSLEHELSWSQSFARYFIGLAHFERDELNEAVAQFKEVFDDPYRHPIQNVTHCAFLLSLSYQTMGRVEQAQEVAGRIGRLTLERGHRQFIELAEAFQAELDLRQGQLAEARRWAGAFVAAPVHPLHRFFNAEFTAVRVFMAQHTPAGTRAAGELLESLQGLADQTHHRRFAIEVLAMKALLAERSGRQDDATGMLREAVRLGCGGQLLRPLLDLGPDIVRPLNRLDLEEQEVQYVGRVVCALRQRDGEGRLSAAVPGALGAFAEPLSPRELEILALYAGNLSNREIAERLFITPGTVKRHAHNIYAKLGVGSRRDAVTKAAALGLLDGA